MNATRLQNTTLLLALGIAVLGVGSAFVHARRDDVLILRLRAPQEVDIVAVPTLTLHTSVPVESGPDNRRVRIGTRTSVMGPEPFVRVDRMPGLAVLVFRDRRVPAGSESTLLFGVHRGPGEYGGPLSLEAADQLRPKLP